MTRSGTEDRRDGQEARKRRQLTDSAGARLSLCRPGFRHHVGPVQSKQSASREQAKTEIARESGTPQERLEEFAKRTEEKIDLPNERLLGLARRLGLVERTLNQLGHGRGATFGVSRWTKNRTVRRGRVLEVGGMGDKEDRRRGHIGGLSRTS